MFIHGTDEWSPFQQDSQDIHLLILDDKQITLIGLEGQLTTRNSTVWISKFGQLQSMGCFQFLWEQVEFVIIFWEQVGLRSVPMKVGWINLNSFGNL